MKLGIVAPCYNEHEVLAESAGRLTVLMDDLVAKKKIDADSFILFVNDGSRDNTWEIISYLFEDMCDAVITIDADLQDDLKAIEEMVDRYNEGYDIVYGVKISRDADSFMKRNTALVFYKLQRSLGVKAIHNHADFRLMSRRALEQLSHFKERNLYLRGLVPLIGYKSTTVDDAISERTAGKSKYTLKKMLALAMDGITSFSTKPISLILGAGFFFLFISIVMTVYILLSYWEHATVPGWTSMMLSLWFIGSIVLLAIGVIGQYIGKIYIEVKNRPLYNIETLLCDKKSKLQDTSSK